MKKIPTNALHKFEMIHLHNISPSKCQNREFTNSSSNPLISWLFRNRLETVITNMVYRYFDRVLDIGCGEGVLLYQLANHFEHCDGIDIDIQAACLLIQHMNLRNIILNEGDFLKYDFKARQFDQIITTDVLEHISDLNSALKKISTLLAAKGSLYVTLPSENLFYRIGRIDSFDSACESVRGDNWSGHDFHHPVVETICSKAAGSADRSGCNDGHSRNFQPG